jgi:predicted TIM-barrel fold metal-dependent hydrolase
MTPKNGLNRREFLAGTLAAGTMATRTDPASGVAAQGEPRTKDLVIDCHAHLNFRTSPADEGNEAAVLDAADRLGIDRLCCSILPGRPATVEGFQTANRVMAAAHKRHPDRFLGYCFVNPGRGRAALEEVRRCLDLPGFIGVKLYNEHLCTDPVVYPLVELTIELRVPILHHAGHSHYPVTQQPNMSGAGHLAELAGRYPEAKLICGHIGGGGDWEWSIKALRHARTVYLDTSGSVTDEAMIDMAVKVLGADRLLFGCDTSWTAGVGKIRAAQLTAAERSKILGGNMGRLLDQRGTRA